MCFSYFYVFFFFFNVDNFFSDWQINYNIFKNVSNTDAKVSTTDIKIVFIHI